MPSAELTLALEGIVTLRDFADEVKRLYDLTNALTREYADGQTLRWVVSDLQVGSAEATVKAEVDTPETAERLEQSYLQVARFVGASDQPLVAIPPSVLKHAQAIVSALDGNITGARFEAGGEAVEIASPSAAESMVERSGAYGSLLGQVETLSSHRRLRFTLYEALRGDPIRCYFQEDLFEQVRNAWGRQVQVVGWVVREAAGGHPVEIRRVRQVIPLDEGDAPDFRAALGAIPWQEGMPTAVEAIRQERDG
jgi:hypothetical protein